MSMCMIIRSGTPDELAALLRAPDAMFGDATQDEALLDIDQSWHILHFLFSGAEWEGRPPADTLVAGGQEVGEEYGYGPGRLVPTEETVAFARFLDSLSLEELRRRIDCEEMERLNIYGVGAWDGADGVMEYISQFFLDLKTYVAAAAARRQGLAIWLI